MAKKARRKSSELTQKTIESEYRKAVPLAKERERRVAVCHERSMYLAVQPSGVATWRLKYKIGNRAKEISLLVTFSIGEKNSSLKLARERREEAKRLLEAGHDPSVVRQSKYAEGEDTVMAVAADWFKTKTGVSKETQLANRKRLEKFIFPVLGRTPIRSIKPKELLTVLRRIVAGEKNIETARRVRSLCSGIWRHAVLNDKADFNIAGGLSEGMANAEPKHFASIKEPREFGKLLRAIDAYESGQPLTRLALKLMALVFVRSFELRGAEWREFDLDADKPVWRIPAERMKMDDPHIVALAPQAVTILREIEIYSGGGRLVFPGLRTPARHMSENTLNAALRNLGYAGSVHVTHGFRSSASTLLHELNFESALIELQLAHTDRNKVRASYNFATRLDDRRRMLCAWADYCDTLRAGDSKVVPIRKTAA